MEVITQKPNNQLWSLFILFILLIVYTKSMAHNSSEFITSNNANLITEKEIFKLPIIEYYDSIDRVYFRFTSPEGLQRQLLLGIKEGLTELVDYGYDAELLDPYHPSECTWKIDDVQFVILGIGMIYDGLELPLEIRVGQAGVSLFEVQSLAEIASNIKINLLDKETGEISTLEEYNPIELDLPEGTYIDRFYVSFELTSLGIEEIEMTNNNLSIYYDLSNKTIVIQNTKSFTISSIYIYNLLGERIYDDMKVHKEEKINITNIFNPGVYIIRFVYNNDKQLSKRIIVK